MSTATSAQGPPSRLFLSVQQRVAAVRQRYAKAQRDYANILVYGDFGTGKTSLAATAPTPVLIDSFDPGGTKTAVLQKKIASGDIIVDSRWERDSWKNPTQYAGWEAEFEEREQSGFFDAIGTYFIDSLTRLADSMMWEILRRGTNGKTRVGKFPELQDYRAQQFTTVDILGRLMNLPCHVVVTGHIGLLKDEVTGALEAGLLLAGKLSTMVPLVFDERYVAMTRTSPNGTSHVLLTRNNGRYKAETRRGGLVFSEYEQPDLRRLLKLAGYSHEDKPPIPLADPAEAGETS